MSTRTRFAQALATLALLALPSLALSGNLSTVQLRLGTWVGDSAFVPKATSGSAGTWEYNITGLIQRDTTEAVDVSDYCFTCWHRGNLSTTAGLFRVLITTEAASVSVDTIYVAFDSSPDGRIWSTTTDDATKYNPIVPTSATGQIFFTTLLGGMNVAQGASPGTVLAGKYLRVRLMLDNSTAATLTRAKVYLMYPRWQGSEVGQ